MKVSTYRFIFIMVVTILTVLAIYFVYIDGRKNKKSIQENKENIETESKINIGISKYDTINPILSRNRDIQYIDKLVFEPLISIDKNFKVNYILANEFSKLDNKTYIVKLKDNIYWHDGELFTGGDVVFTINALKNKNINSIYKENVKNIKKIEEVDDFTLKISLNEEIDFFEYIMCIPIVSEHAYDKDTLESKKKYPVGTGKFKIYKMKDKSIILKRVNENDVSKIKSIKIMIKDTTEELYDSLINKEIDMMITENIEYEDCIGSMGYNVYKICNRGFDYLAFNNKNSILMDKNIRKAIDIGIDKNRINKSIYNNMYNITCFPLDSSNYLYNNVDLNDYNTNKAIEYLEENGCVLRNNIWYKDGRKLIFRLLVDKNNKKRVEVAKNIKEQLNKINIIINIIEVNDKLMNYYIKYNNYDMILTGNLISNSPDLGTYFGDNNISKYENEEINDILKQINSIDNQEDVLKEKYDRIIEIYKEEKPFISLYFNSLFIITNKNLKGSFECNWYNLFYNIDNWYKVKDN